MSRICNYTCLQSFGWKYDTIAGIWKRIKETHEVQKLLEQLAD
jgi:hypothetical protein